MPDKKPSLEEVLNSEREKVLTQGSKVQQEDQAIGLNVQDFGKSQYDQKASIQDIEEGLLNRVRAEYQGPVAGIANTALGIIPKVGLGILETAGNILDLENYAGALGITKTDYDNWFSNIARQGAEAIDEQLPVYLKNPGDVFDPTDSAWWIKNISGVVESAAEFGATGFGIGKLAGTGINALKAFNSPAAKVMAKTLNTVSQPLTTIALTHAEGVLTGQQVYQDVYNKQIEEGKSEEEANQLAADAASTSVQLNYLNTALNYTSLTPFFRGNNLNSKLVSEELKRLPKETLEEYTKRVGNYTPSFKRTLNTIKKEGLQEAGEEWINIIAQNEGLYQGGAKEMEGDNFFSRAIESATSEEGLTSAALGAFGGAAQTAITTQLTKKDRPELQKAWDIQRQAIIDNFGDEGIFLAKDIKEAGILQEELKKAVLNKDETQAEFIKSKLADLVDYRNLRTGTTKDLEDRYTEMNQKTFTEEGIQDLISQGIIESGSSSEIQELRTKISERKQTLKRNEDLYNNLNFKYANKFEDQILNDNLIQTLFNNKTSYNYLLKEYAKNNKSKAQAASILQSEIGALNINQETSKTGEPLYGVFDPLSTESYNKFYKSNLSKIKSLDSYQELQKLEDKSKEIGEVIQNLNKDFQDLTSEKGLEKFKNEFNQVKEEVKEPIVETPVEQVPVEETKQEIKQEESAEEFSEFVNFTPIEDLIKQEEVLEQEIAKVAPDNVVEQTTEEVVKDDPNELVPRISNTKVREKWNLPTEREIKDLLEKGKDLNSRITLEKTISKNTNEPIILVKLDNKVIGNINNKVQSDNIKKLYETLKDKEYSSYELEKLGISFSLTKGSFDFINTPTLVKDLNIKGPTLIVDTNSETLLGKVDTDNINFNLEDTIKGIPNNLGRYVLLLPDNKLGTSYLALYPSSLENTSKTEDLFNELQTKSQAVKDGKISDLDEFNKSFNSKFYISLSKLPSSKAVLDISPDGAIRLTVDVKTDKGFKNFKKVYVNNINKENYSFENLIEDFNNKLKGEITLTTSSFKTNIPTNISNKNLGESFQTFVSPDIFKGQNLIINFDDFKPQEELEEDINISNTPEPTVTSSVSNEVADKYKEVSEKLNSNISTAERVKLIREQIELASKLPKSDEDIVYKKASSEYENISQEELNWLKVNLPDFISIEDINTISKNVNKLNQTWGAFKDGVIYLNKNAGQGTGYHEAFHAVFRMLLTDKQINTYLKLAKQEYTGDLKQAIEDLKSDHPSLNNNQLEDLVYEEYIADKFEQWKTNKSVKTNSIFKTIFRKILEFFKFFTGSQGESFEALFSKIDSGVFRSAIQQENRFNTINNPVYKLIPTSPDLYLNPRTGVYEKTNSTLPQNRSIELINSFAAKVRNNISNQSLKNTETQKEALYQLIAERIEDLSSAETDAYINSKPENIKQQLNNKRNKELFSLTDPTALMIIQEQVLAKLDSVKNFEDIDENDIDGANGVVERFGNADSWTIGGEASLSKAIREYISFGTYTKTDELTGKEDLFAIDGKYVYNGVLRALSGTPEDKMLQKLYLLSQDNVNIKGFVDMLFKDTGIKVDENNNLSTASKNLNNLRQIIVGFKKYKANQIFTNLKPNFKKNEFLGMDVEVGNANTNDPKRIQISEWSSRFQTLINDNKQEFLKTTIDNIVKTYNSGSSSLLTDEQVNKKVESLKDEFEKLGITLSQGYLRYSYLSNKIEDISTLTNKQYNYVQSFNEQKPLDISIFKGGQVSAYSLLEDKTDWYDPDKGILGRLGEIADNNSVFDETIGESSFKNAEGKTVYDIIQGSYVLEEATRLNEGVYRNMLRKDEFLSKNYLLTNYDTFLNNLSINIIDGLRDSSKDNTNEKKEGKVFGSYTEREYLIQQLSYFATKSKGEAFYIFRQNEAANTAYISKMPVLTLTDKNNNPTDEVVDIFYNKFLNEFSRINREWEKANSTGEFVGGNIYKYNDKPTSRAFKFTEFEYLEFYLKNEYQDIINSARNGEEIDSNKIKKAIKSYLENGIKTYKTSLANNNLVTLKSGNIISANLLPSKLEKDYDNFDKAVSEFYLNDYLFSSSLNELFDGDYAISRKDKVDITKRHKGAMGSGPNFGSGNHTVAFIKDINKYVVTKPVNGNLIRVVKSGDIYIDENNNQYTSDLISEINSNDAQSYSNIYHKIFALKRLGKFDRNIQRIYKDLIQFTKKDDQGNIIRNWNINTKDQKYLEQLNSSLNPDKTVTFGREWYIKTSEFILNRGFVSYVPDSEVDRFIQLTDEINSLIDQDEFNSDRFKEIKKELTEIYQALPGKEYWHNMLQQMDQNSIDQVATESASKGKTIIPQDSSKDYDLSKSIATIPNEYKRLQVETPTGKTKISAGTQLMQLIDTEQDDSTPIEVEFDNSIKNIGQLRAKYRELMAKTRDNSFKVAISYIREYSNGTIDKSRLDKKLERAIKQSGGDDFLNEMFSTENGVAKYNFNLLPLIDKAEQIILAHFSSGVLAQKVPGTKVSLVSDAGIKVNRDGDKVILSSTIFKNPENYKNLIQTDLRHNIKSDGEVYSECILSESILTKYGLKIGDEIPVELSKLLGYRIPTQDKHSMISLRIVDVMPNYMEGSGIFPAEIVYLSGADFDIDSLFIQTPAFRIDENNKPIKYGTEDSPEEKFESLKAYLLSDKDFKSVYKELLENNKQYQYLQQGDIERFDDDTDEEYQDLVKAKNQELKKIKEEVLTQTLEYFKYPTNSKEYTKYIEINGEINNNTLNNEILESQIKMLTNEYINKEIAYTPASTSDLEEEAIYIESLKTKSSEIPDKYISASDINGKVKAFSKNSAGKAGIGPVANSLQVFTFLSKDNVQLEESAFKFSIDNNINTGYINLNSQGKRIADLLSTILSAMTDNAKNPIAGRMNLNLNLLSTYVNLIMQGTSKRQATLLLNTPSIQEYSKQKEVQSFGIQTPNEAKLKKFIIKTNLFSKYGKDVPFSELRVLYSNYNFSSEDLEKLIKGELSADKANDLNAAALFAWLNLEEQAEVLSNINTLLKTNKGLPTSFEELENQFDKAIGELGLSEIVDYESNYDNRSPVNIAQTLIKDKHTLKNIKITKKVIDVSSKLLISQTKPFRKELNKLFNNLKPSSVVTTENRDKIKKDFLGFISTRGYIESLKKILNSTENEAQKTKFSKRLNLMNDSLVFPELEGSTLAEQLANLKTSEDETIKNNLLVRYLRYKFKFNQDQNGELELDETNKKQMDIVEGRSFIKESPSMINDLVDAYKQLYNNPETQEFAINMFNYLIVKDNLQFKSGSFVKFIAPFMFKEISLSLDKTVNELSKSDGNYQSLFNKSFEDLGSEFREIFSRYKPNTLYLNYRSNEVVTNKGKEPILGFNLATKREDGLSSYKAVKFSDTEINFNLFQGGRDNVKENLDYMERVFTKIQDPNNPKYSLFVFPEFFNFNNDIYKLTNPLNENGIYTGIEAKYIKTESFGYKGLNPFSKTLAQNIETFNKTSNKKQAKSNKNDNLEAEVNGDVFVNFVPLSSIFGDSNVVEDKKSDYKTDSNDQDINNIIEDNDC